MKSEKNTSSTSKTFKEMIRDRYGLIVHVDNESVICTNHVTKGYDIHEINNVADTWSEGIKAILSGGLNS